MFSPPLSWAKTFSCAKRFSLFSKTCYHSWFFFASGTAALLLSVLLHLHQGLQARHLLLAEDLLLLPILHLRIRASKVSFYTLRRHARLADASLLHPCSCWIPHRRAFNWRCLSASKGTASTSWTAAVIAIRVLNWLLWAVWVASLVFVPGVADLCPPESIGTTHWRGNSAHQDTVCSLHRLRQASLREPLSFSLLVWNPVNCSSRVFQALRTLALPCFSQRSRS